MILPITSAGRFSLWGLASHGLFYNFKAVGSKFNENDLGQVLAFLWLNPLVVPCRATVILFGIFDKSRVNGGINDVACFCH